MEKWGSYEGLGKRDEKKTRVEVGDDVLGDVWGLPGGREELGL